MEFFLKCLAPARTAVGRDEVRPQAAKPGSGHARSFTDAQHQICSQAQCQRCSESYKTLSIGPIGHNLPTRSPCMNDVTQILERLEKGDAKVAGELLPLVYKELRQLAAAKMAQEKPGQTLQSTALVHEAWLRLVGGPTQNWNNREHFFRAAAEAMRHILVDRARERLAHKRGGELRPTELSESKAGFVSPDEELLAVHDALEALSRGDPVSAELVKLRYFVGLNMAETAEALGMLGAPWPTADVWSQPQNR